MNVDVFSFLPKSREKVVIRFRFLSILYIPIRKMAMAARIATISRKTNETEIEVSINLDCQPGSASEQIIDVSTGIGFLDHVRFFHQNLAFFFLVHSRRDLRIQSTGVHA
jgi:hypothetical protein